MGITAIGLVYLIGGLLGGVFLSFEATALEHKQLEDMETMVDLVKFKRIVAALCFIDAAIGRICVFHSLIFAS